MADTLQPPKTYEIRDLPILSVGTWNGREWTRDMLAAAVDAFTALRRALLPAVTLDHDEGETRRMAGGPRLGNVMDMRLSDDGDTIVADLEDLPILLARAIQRGNYGDRSIEAFFDVDFYGEKLPVVITAVSFLGADVPGVDGLGFEALEALYHDDEVVTGYAASINHIHRSGAVRWAASFKAADLGKPTFTAHQESSMDAILEALGLETGADEAAIVAKIRETMEQAQGGVALTELRAALGLGEEADAAAVLAAITAKAAESETEPEGEPDGEPAAEPEPDAELAKLPPALLAKLAKAQKTADDAVATLARERAERRIEELIDDDKLLPAQASTFLSLAVEQPKHFAAVVATLKPNGLLGKPKGHGHNAPATDLDEPTDSEVAVFMSGYNGHPNPPDREEAMAILRRVKHDARTNAGQED